MKTQKVASLFVLAVVPVFAAFMMAGRMNGEPDSTIQAPQSPGLELPGNQQPGTLYIIPGGDVHKKNRIEYRRILFGWGKKDKEGSYQDRSSQGKPDKDMGAPGTAGPQTQQAPQSSPETRDFDRNRDMDRSSTGKSYKNEDAMDRDGGFRQIFNSGKVQTIADIATMSKAPGSGTDPGMGTNVQNGPEINRNIPSGNDAESQQQ